MKAKRLILMLLVMLISVTGACEEYLVVDGHTTVTIDEDNEYRIINVWSESTLIISEGVNITVSESVHVEDCGSIILCNGATLTNLGSALDVCHDGTVIIQTGAKVIGHSNIENRGKIINHGLMDGNVYLNEGGFLDNHGEVENVVNYGGTSYNGQSVTANGMTYCPGCGEIYEAEEPSNYKGIYYLIANAGNLYHFAKYVKSNSRLSAMLTADIVMNDGTFDADGNYTAKVGPNLPYVWEGIGDEVYGHYKGTFDGNGHTISGLYVDAKGEYGYGLFKNLDQGGSVVNLGIVNCCIRGSRNGGAICYNNNGTISNCYSTGFVSVYGVASGICSDNKNTISNCYSTCTLNSLWDGLSGICSSNSGTVSNCYVSDDNGIIYNNGTESGVYYGISAERFASGEIAYKLNGSVDGEGNWTAGPTDGKQKWYQTIGTDANPVLKATGSNTVYVQNTYNCGGTLVSSDYSNAGEDIHQPHSYEESILDDASYYTCDACGYVDEMEKAQFDARNYLSMKAVGGTMTITMTKTGLTNDTYKLQTSTDGIKWSEPVALSATSVVASIESGKTCYFRFGGDGIYASNNGDNANALNFNDNNHWTFLMEGDGTVEAGGNIMSLIDRSVRHLQVGTHAFSHLFEGCAKLTAAPKVPATTLGQWCYRNMFQGTGITEAPRLPATYIKDGSYAYMFKNCTNLESAFYLPAVRVDRCGCKEMFYGCVKLTSVEIGKISQIDGRTDSSNGSFYDWLKDTAADGIVLAPITMLGNSLVVLPANWQWATMLRANADPDGTGYYTTFYDSRFAYTLPRGVKAYTSTIEEVDEGKVVKLTAIEGGILPKDVAVLLHSNTTSEMLMTVSSENGNAPAMNLFRGVDEDTDQDSPINYMLSYGQYGLGFYRMREDMMLSAHKAFLPHSPDMANAHAFCMVFDNGEATGIEQIENGELNIEKSVIYNLGGQRINRLQKGINIINGKKLIVK